MSFKSLTIKNNTGSAVTIADIGIVIAASGQDTFTELETIRMLMQSESLRSLATDATPTLTLNDGTSDIEKAAVPNFIQYFDTGRSATMICVDPAGTMDYLTIEEALGGALDQRGTNIALRGDQTHDVDSVLDVRGVVFHAIGEGRPVIRAQTGGQLEIGGTTFRGIKIEVPSTTGGFSGTFFLDVIEGGNDFIGCDFSPESGKSVFGCDTPIAFSTVVMRFCGQSGGGTMVDSGSSFTSPFWIVSGTNLVGTMEFDAEDVYMDDSARADTTTGVLYGIPNGALYVAPGERIQVAVDSVGSIGGGVVYLLPGTHDIIDSINVTNNKVTLSGLGNAVVRAQTATWVGGTTNDDAAINFGATDGSAPIDECTCEGFEVFVEPNIHGIQVNGGRDNHVHHMHVESTAIKSALRVGILFTDSLAAVGSGFICDNCKVYSSDETTAWVDGVHMDGNNTLSTYGYGNGIEDSIIYSNIVNYALETCYVFVDVNHSSIFTNRATDVCYNVGAIGLAAVGGMGSVIIGNTINGNNQATSTAGIYINNASAIICEQNVVDGDAVVFPIGIQITGDADNNIIRGNIISNSTAGINNASGCDNNCIGPNIFPTGVTTNYVDGDTSSRYTGAMTQGTGSPHASVIGQFGDTYLDTSSGSTYICGSWPQGTTWYAMGIPIGTAFPASPSDGNFLYRTDDDHLYRYDAGRAKWLGELEWETGGRTGNLISNSYFRRIDGMIMSSTQGVYIPYAVTIVGITWAMGSAVAGTIEVRRDGVLVVGKATGAAASGSDLTLNSDFASGGIFSLYWNSANNTSNTQIKVYYRRLQT